MLTACFFFLAIIIMLVSFNISLDVISVILQHSAKNIFGVWKLLRLSISIVRGFHFLRSWFHLHQAGILLNDFEESLGDVIEQREFITSQDPQGLILFINLFGLLFLQSVICQYFHFILLGELEKKLRLKDLV